MKYAYNVSDYAGVNGTLRKIREIGAAFSKSNHLRNIAIPNRHGVEGSTQIPSCLQ